MPERGRHQHHWHRALPLVIVAAGLAAYHNSFTVPFLFDDVRFIAENTRLRVLWPLWESMGGTARPMVYLSLAMNYALGGLTTWGYHAVNVAIHLLAGVVLFGLVRRTVLLGSVQGSARDTASWLALAASLLWVVHPLQTQSVTYVYQRAESLMGLCYLLTVYCVVRGVGAGRVGPWFVAAIASCAVGMGSKPIMVTAPLMVLIYDRVFLAASFRDAWRRRRALYLGLAATWIVLASLLASASGEYESSAGYGIRITPWEYALTQPGVILHYLRLALWPHPLVLDYGWPPARAAGAIILPGLALLILIGAILWGLRRHPAIGFLGVWVVFILVPTSSVIPIAERAVEHRMYLPLAGLAVLVVLGGYEIAKMWLPTRQKLRGVLVCAVLGVTVMGLGVVTVRRNADYRSALTMWRDVVTKRPNNPHGHDALANVLAGQGRIAEATTHYAEAVRLEPEWALAHYHLGTVLREQGRLDEAIVHYAEALRHEPDSVKAHNDLGSALAEQGRVDDAIAHYVEALWIRPDVPATYNNLGVMLARQGKLRAAAIHYVQTLQLDPSFREAHHNLGDVLRKLGRLDEATTAYQTAIELDPDIPHTHNNLGAVLAQQGRFEEAVLHFQKILRLTPNHWEAQCNLAFALSAQGKSQEAAEYFETVERAGNACLPHDVQ